MPSSSSERSVAVQRLPEQAEVLRAQAAARARRPRRSSCPPSDASRSASVAARYCSSGSRPPSFVPKTIPCRLTCGAAAGVGELARRSRGSARGSRRSSRGGSVPAEKRMPSGSEHGVAGDLLAGVEVLREQRRRHHQRVAGVREAFARRAVGRETRGPGRASTPVRSRSV